MRLAAAVSALGLAGAVILGASVAARGAEAAAGGSPDAATPHELVGKPAPAWTVSRWINLPEAKQTLDIADFKGKVLYLCFFQTTCPGSRSHALPALKALTDHYAGDGSVAFVAVQTAFRDFDRNTPEALAQTAERFKLTIPIGHEGTQGVPPQMLIRYKARGTPWFVIIDRAGIIRHCTHYMPTDQVVTLIDQYRGESPKTAGGPKPGMIGGQAPSWAASHWINLPQGKTGLDVADFRDKVLYLCFFQSSCPGSRSHGLPTLKALTDHYAGDGSVAFVAVQTAFRDFDVNTPERLPETAKHFGLTVPMGHDGAEGRPPQMLIRYKARGTPWFAIIDRGGTIRHSGHYLPTEQVVALIERLKNATPGRPATGADTTAKRPKGPFDLEPGEPVKLSPAGQRLKKRIEAIDKQIVGLLEEEMDLKMALMNAKQKGQQLVKDTEWAAKELAQGRITRLLRQYQAIMAACIQKYQKYDANYAAFQNALKGMERTRAVKEVRKDLDALNAQILARRRANMDQIAGLLEKAGEFKKAVEIYRHLRDLLPPKKDRDTALARRTLQEKIGAAYEACEEYQKSLDAYKVVYEAMPPAKRKGEINLRLKIGNLYEHVGDFKKALTVFEAVRKDLGPGQKVSNLDEVIEKLKERVGG